MLINWFTVVAQAINFLILARLLKRFLYKPILHAIDEREKGIATQLAQAESKKAEAQKERDDFQHKNEAFDQERGALLKKAVDDAKAERQKLLDEARKDADALRAKRQDALRNEQRSLSQDVIRWTQTEVFAIARQALTDLAGTSLEERMSEVFTRRLRELNKDAKEGLAKDLTTSSDPALVRSAYELPSEQRAMIQKTLNETFSAEVRVRFETAPDIISGIELAANGRKLAWSIGDYLASLKTSIAELLKEQSKPEPKPQAKSADKPESKPEDKPKSGAESAAAGVAK
jgi:F-type H+-transporting ATPase subunit b